MIPTRLKKGDTVAIVSPSNPTDERRKKLVDNAINYLNSKGFNVVYAKNALEIDKFGIKGGTAEQKAKDINNSFMDSSIKAIWCAQGGETANETLELLDYELIKKNPKLFMGMSDIDVLLLAINKKTGLITFNAPDPKIGEGEEFDYVYSKEAFNERLMQGKIGEIKKNSEWKCVRNGKARGNLLGCNMGSILKLAGTNYLPKFDKSIIFLEGLKLDVQESISKLIQLKHMGIFDKVNGLVIGYIYGFQAERQLDKNGNRVNFEDIVLGITKDYTFPILKINEFGHRCPNCFLPIGIEVELDATNKRLSILKDCVK